MQFGCRTLYVQLIIYLETENFLLYFYFRLARHGVKESAKLKRIEAMDKKLLGQIDLGESKKKKNKVKNKKKSKSKYLKSTNICD